VPQVGDGPAHVLPDDDGSHHASRLPTRPPALSMPHHAASASHLADAMAVSFPTPFRQTPVRPNADTSY
jgi:hypothetical protein